MSEGGARLVGGTPIAPGTSVRFAVPGTAVTGSGIVRHVQTLQTPLSIHFSMGVELANTPAPSRRWLGFGRRRPTHDAVANDLVAATAPVDKEQAYVS